MNLKQFQLDAIARLDEAMATPGKRNIVFKSPTGSGKTIVLTRFMAEYMRNHANTLFVWLTPGQGDLEEQSKAKMDRYCNNASTKLLADVMTSGFSAGDAVFINWQKLTNKSNTAIKDSERTNFLEWIEKAFNSGLEFKVVIDESHHSFTEKTDTVVKWFKTDKIIRASATPNNDPRAIVIEVDEEDVIAEGLIKKRICINPGFPMQIDLAEEGDKTCYLLNEAYKKYEELKQAFNAAGSVVRPLILVQLPNNSDELLKTVEKWFAAKGIDVDNGTFAVWLANRKDNIDGLTNNDGQQVAVAIKQAVATGWDCPRAHILVKLRDNMDERFEIQSIGRVRRMPEARHYGNDLLDSCYLYTFDAKFTAGVLGHDSDGDLQEVKLFIKPEFKKIELISEQRTMVSETQDVEYAFISIKKYLKKRLGLTADVASNKVRFESAKFKFGEIILGSTLSGDVATLGALENATGQLNSVTYGLPLDTHEHGHLMRHSLAAVGKAIALEYEDIRLIFGRLFNASVACKDKYLELKPKEFYAFIINNEKLLEEEFKRAIAGELLLTTSKGNVSTKQFRFPHEYICVYDAGSRRQGASTKNVYENYPLSAMTTKTRSKGEMKFEQWCEKHKEVEWVYRNGDKGDEYFSIVYVDNSGKQRLFFPDYILNREGEIWIVEVKGGWNTSGGSENIDIYAPKKAVALNAYCKKHKLRGGFVAYDASEDILLLSESGYSEDLNNPCWKEW